MVKKNLGGRPTKMTEMTIKKLEEAFALGCTDLEACLYADISKPTLYKYQDENPEFLDRKTVLKERPVLLARQSVIKGMEEDSKLAMDYLKNKKSDEFSTASKSSKETLGADGQPVDPPKVIPIEIIGVKSDVGE